MDFDFDPSGELPGSNNARVGRKFKPKPKLAPVKPTNNAEEKAATPFSDDSGVEVEQPFISAHATNEEFTECIEPSVLGDRDPLSSDAVEYHRDSATANVEISLGFEPVQGLESGISCHNEASSPALNEDLLASSTFGGQSSANSLAFKESSTYLLVDSGELLCEVNCYPEIQSGNEYPGAGNASQNPVNSAMPSNAQCISDTFQLDDESIPGFPSDDAVDYSSLSFADFMDSNPSASDFPRSEEQPDVANTIHADDMHKTSQNVKLNELDSGKNEDSKSSRQLKEQSTAPQVDNLEDECGDGQFHAAPSTSSVPGEEGEDFEYRLEEEDDDNDEEYREDRKSKKEKAVKNPKKPAPEKEKTIRKRKKSNNVPEQPVQKPRKKFSHSTRRKKERVKELLSIPKDEINLLRLPLKDICLLGEHNDLLAKKEAKESKTSGTNHSANNSFHGADYYDEEDPFSAEQDEGYTDGQTNSREGSSYALFNSRSFMDREPTVRWSKQDTELFYEGIRQFGSDLSMIQQLFPGRTRDHMKKKFQKEGRVHPLRLSEAMRSRASDHSYFKKVIEQLRKASAQSEPISNKDDLDDIAGKEEAEIDSRTNDETINSKLEEDVGDREAAGYSHEALDSDGGEDEWTYTSEL